MRTGTITVPAGTKAGATVRIWVDRAGNPTDAPLSPDKAAGAAVVVALVAWAAFAGLLAVVFYAVRARLARSSQEAWEREWQHLDGRPSAP